MRRRLMAALAATVALPMMAAPVSAQEESGEGYERGDYYAGSGGPPNPPRTPDRYITEWPLEPPHSPGVYVGDWAGAEQALREAERRFRQAQAERFGRAYGYDAGDYYRGPGSPAPAPPYAPNRYVSELAPTPPHRPSTYLPDWEQAERRLGEFERRLWEAEQAYRDAERRYREAQRYPEDYDRGLYGPRPLADDRWADRPNYDRTFDRPSPPPGYYERGGGPRQGAGGDVYRDLDFRRDFRQDGRRGYYQDSAYEEMPFERPRTGGGMDVPNMERIRRAMRLIDTYDVDKDGRVTQEEIDRFRSERLQQFDREDDDALTLAEYEELWLDAMRDRVVRRFQHHDVDGDGLVTMDEFGAETQDFVRMRDRDRDEGLTLRDFGMEDERTDRAARGAEDYTGRPQVEAPLGGSPNEPAEAPVNGDEDTSAYGPRPEVEAPLGESPNEPAGPETYDEIEPAD